MVRLGYLEDEEKGLEIREQQLGGELKENGNINLEGQRDVRNLIQPPHLL